MSKLVNLDAMIARADFAAEESEQSTENVRDISLRDFLPQHGLIGPTLRKPDFQRETNHWTPDQVLSLLDCYVNGDLIPSVILWKSSRYLFVIDGGHRLSALRAWVQDDYGDGPVSLAFFGHSISRDQRDTAKRTRDLINSKIGSWQHFWGKQQDGNPDEQRRVTAAVSRALPIQWVVGNADKAETSFFKINTQGTPLDEIEELLLRNRRRPIPIASRAVIRAGKGHRYWSAFEAASAKKIEDSASALHEVLFDPELRSPVKTLDLPLGGAKGVRMALQILIDFMLIAARDQKGVPNKVGDQAEDSDGAGTLEVLKKALRLARRVSGNDGGSLGLHPAVYFYGPTGRHSSPLFMGTMSLVAKQLANNNSQFFATFTRIRPQLESALIEHKDLIATIVQKLPSVKRLELVSKPVFDSEQRWCRFRYTCQRMTIMTQAS